MHENLRKRTITDRLGAPDLLKVRRRGWERAEEFILLAIIAAVIVYAVWTIITR